MNATFPVWLDFLIPIAIGGLYILVRALQGKVVGDHPYCRRCGFDLFGLPADQARCPECGAELSAKRAVKIGVRQRRPGVAVVGLALLLPGLIVFSVLGWRKLAAVEWIRYEPYWYVLRQAHSSDPAVVDPALAELLRRVSGGQVSDARLTRLTEEMLAAQADLSRAWLPVRGDIIEEAHAQRKLPDEKWREYLVNMPQFKLAARPEVRRGEDLPVQLHQGNPRCGTRSEFRFGVVMAEQPTALLKPTTARSAKMSTIITLHSGMYVNSIVPIDAKAEEAAPDGPQIVNVHVTMEIDGPPPAATKELDLSTPWKLVPAGAPTIKAINDPTLREKMEAALSIRELVAGEHDTMIWIVTTGLPAGLSHHVIARAGDREWELTTITGNRSVSAASNTKGIDADVVDIVLRPDPKIILGTVDQHSYYNGELLLKNVKVERSRRAVVEHVPATKKAS